MIAKPLRYLLILGASFALAAVCISTAEAGPITSGQLVNIRVGDGTTVATGNALPVTLDVYDVTYTGSVPTGVTLSQSIPLLSSAVPPTSGNRNLTQGGTAAAEGGLTLSGDGNYMALAGYNAAPGTGASGGTSNRVVGRLDLAAGTVDTTTALTDASASSNAWRAAYTTNGTDIWASGSTGARYTTLGATTSTALATGNNSRRITVFGGQLYQSEAANMRFGVESIGTGTPTTGGQTIALLPGFPTSGLSPYDFFFADANTLYIGDDRTTGTGGLQKWTFDGTNWSLAFSLLVNPAGSNKGLKSLSGRVDGNVVTLFAATTDTTANYLYGFSDTLSNTSAGSVIANKLLTASTDFTGGAVWNLRGVAIAPGGLIPEPGSVYLILLGALAAIARRSR